MVWLSCSANRQSLVRLRLGRQTKSSQKKREIKGEKGINETHNQNSVVLCGMFNSDIKVREEMR